MPELPYHSVPRGYCKGVGSGRTDGVDMVIDAYEMRIDTVKGSVKTIVSSLHRIANEVDRDLGAFLSDEPNRYFDSATDLVAAIDHTVAWGVANLSIGSLIRQAKKADDEK